MPIAAGDRHRAYNRMRRESDALYGTARWKRLRREKLARDPLCEPCQTNGRVVLANTVHHREVVSEHGTAGFFDLDGLESVCRDCHARLHAGHVGAPQGG